MSLKNQEPSPLQITIIKHIEQLEESVELLKDKLQQDKDQLQLYKNLKACNGKSGIGIPYENTPENRLRNWKKFKEVWGDKFSEPWEYDKDRSCYNNIARFYAYIGYIQDEDCIPEYYEGFDDMPGSYALEDLIERCELLKWNDITCMVEIYGTQYDMGPRKIFDFYGNMIGFYVDDKVQRDYTHNNRITDITKDMEGAWFFYENER